MCLMQPEGGGIIIMYATHLDVESSLKQGLWLLFFDCHKACGILVPLSGIWPRPPAVKVQSPNHWIAREFPSL